MHNKFTSGNDKTQPNIISRCNDGCCRTSASRTLRECFGEHRRGIQNNTDESVPIHFNQPKHSLNDAQLISVLHINNNRDSIRLSVEQHLIEKAGTLQNGINRTCAH